MVVCNDWHSALVPMFIHAEKSTNPGAFLQRAGQRPTVWCRRLRQMGQHQDGFPVPQRRLPGTLRA